MEEIVPLVVSAASAIPSLVNAFSSSKPPQTDNPSARSMDMQPLPSSDSVVLSSQPLPPAPPPPLGSSLGRSPQRLIIPFQRLYFDLTGTETKSNSVTVQSLPNVSSIIKGYRDAYLVNLEAVVFPSAPSLKIPVTVDLCWTTADVTVEGFNVLATPSSARITMGGLALMHQATLPCDLGYINPIIKSPIPYTNHPRLNIHFHQSADAVLEGVRAGVKASVVIRGSISVSHPLVTGHG
ncbi:coat protein [Bombyx mori latent virus]|uniref:Coat protein n=1 Tax=Bombyx mori latent virus TaxID=2065033 RepID=Q6AW70_9VIRU|nr:coat protein [Bombyx mori latent virus]BAD35018.1 coat protein [Bombyx mori latent virus]